MRNDGDFYIGKGQSSWDAYKGDADEFRVSSTIRSSKWIESQNETMRNQAVLIGPIDEYMGQ